MKNIPTIKYYCCPNNSRMSGSRANRGFVLLMVLTVLVIAGSVLGVSAYRYARQTLQAGRFGRDLQLKWANLSLRSVYLSEAENVLQIHSQEKGFPVASFKMNVKLGGIEFELILSDEQAKANVNTLVGLRGSQEANESLVKLLSDLPRVVNVELQPTEPAEKTPESTEKTQGWKSDQYVTLDQVFSFDSPSELLAQELEEKSPLDRITCWGEGLLNFRCVDALTLGVVGSDVLSESEVQQLIELRDKTYGSKFNRVATQLEFTNEQKEFLKKILTDKSHCYSLWVIAKGQTRNFYRLHVDQECERPEDSKLWSFQW